MTDNHQFNTPSEGTQDWHVPINSNFQQLDSTVEIRDSESNLSEYEAKDGAKFVSTDSKRVFLGDGSEWNYLTTLGGIGGEIFVQSAEPSGSEGDIWVKTP